jgi:hypothetical protein
MNYVQNNILNNNNFVLNLIKWQRYFSKAKLCDWIFYKLLMWFWLVNEMIELVSGMPAPHFGDESTWVRGSELVQGLKRLLYSLRCLCVPSGVRLPQVEYHWFRLYSLLVWIMGNSMEAYSLHLQNEICRSHKKKLHGVNKTTVGNVTFCVHSLRWCSKEWTQNVTLRTVVLLTLWIHAQQDAKPNY